MDLSNNVGILPSIGPVYRKRLEKLDINTVESLLLHIPHRYLDFRESVKIFRTKIGDTVTVKGEVASIKNLYTKHGKKFQVALVKDDSGEITVIWFNQPFLVRNIFPGDTLSLSGKIDWFGRKKTLISPEYEKVTGNKKPVHTGRLVPVYPETSGLSSKWLRAKINLTFPLTKTDIKEFLPVSILQKYNLDELVKAIENVHFPESFDIAEKARKRLAFNELLFFQGMNVFRQQSWRKNIPANKLSFAAKDIAKFTDSLPFTLTASQNKAVEEITDDLKKSYPMNRLLEGDVGSGKTVVAATAAFVSFINGCQSVFMAPTQILAGQHFNTLNSLFTPYKVRVSLLTAGIKKGDLGRSDIFVGTHTLIHSKIDFDKVGLVVIDEQHRFGVEQREHLIKKTRNKTIVPHVLTMTATPIPRTVALTFYGDLSLSTLNELPKGRQDITTWIVPPQKRDGAFKWIGKNIKETKAQAYVVCPLIEESAAETMQSVKAATGEYRDIKLRLPNLVIGLLHGRMTAKEKDLALNGFRSHRTDILVATPVVEVGIDVPNATIMVIEGAERFGLAQLHQLRGRVGRGEKKSYCLLFGESLSPKALSRLNALQKSSSGFELAELDLKLRGPGEIYGLKQHGLPELKIASWQDVNSIKNAKDVAGEAFRHPAEYKLFLNKLNSLLHKPA